MPYIITEMCTNDGACVEVCPVACIHTKPGAPQHYIDPDICIECEQCEIVCPPKAIFVDWKLPDEHFDSIEVNARFFRENKAAPEAITFETALAMIHEAQTYATDTGIAVAVAVVDEGGAPIALGCMDGVSPWASELALHKAQTSAAMWLPTADLRPEGRRPWFRSLTIGSRGRMLAVAGGLPITQDIVVFGAIGVAGGRTDEQDVLCCRAGLSVLAAPTH